MTTDMGTVLVNSADWSTPKTIPEGWVIANAPRPIQGQITWTGPFRHGTFYAASPEIPEGTFGWKADDAWLVVFITDAEITERAKAKVAEHGYASLEDADVTMEEMAAMMELPWSGAAA